MSPSKRKILETQMVETIRADEGDGDSSEGSHAKKQRLAAVPWTKEEELAVIQVLGELALNNIPLFSRAPEIKDRGPAKINVKVRAMIKKIDQMYSGDGAWVADFKVAK